MTTQATLYLEQQLRRVSARTTKEIVLRRGGSLGMYLGCGYPKSGTVWLCQLMAAHMGLPYPREYQLPVMMPAVIHTHWTYDRRFPPTAYIMRDGRDLMVSLYFYSVRAMGMAKSPSRVKRLRELFTHLYGPNADVDDIRGNLPKFIEHEMTSPRATHGTSWPEHVGDWVGRDNVVVTSYEALLRDTPGELHRVVSELTSQEQDPVLAQLAAQRFEFKRASGRSSGTEDRSSFLRKGVSGDWTNNFTQEAGEVFDAFAGNALVKHGYADDRNWWKELSQ